MSILQIEINLFTWELLSLCKFALMTHSRLQTYKCAVLCTRQNPVAVLSVYTCRSWFYKIGSDKPPHSWMGSSPQGSLVSHQCRGTSQVLILSSVVVIKLIHSHKGVRFFRLRTYTKELATFHWSVVDIFNFSYSFAELVHYFCVEWPLYLSLPFQNVSIHSFKVFLRLRSV